MSNLRLRVFYDAEGRVSAYQNYFGPVFVDVTNIQYDAQGRIVGYTETTRGGGTKVVFNITFDSAGRIASQQFTDSTLKLRFGNVNTQTFTYDEKTGKLLEFKIENGDFIAVFDGKGNRKSFELSAQMKAFIEEEQRKAVEAAKRRAQKEAAKENKKLISRKEIIENAKGNKKLKRLLDTLPKDKKGQIQLGDAEIEFLLRKSKTFRKFVLSIGISKQQLKAVLNSSIRAAGRVIAVSVGAIRESVAGKILATIKEAIKARAPNLTGEEILAATLVKRIEEVFEVTDEQGRVHRVTEITRLDGNGNQIERIVIDKFTFRNEKGKKVKARIVSIFDSQDRLTRIGETYKQKKKKGTLITKRTTVFDPATGEIISTKTKQDFKKSGFFNSSAGKIVGALLVVAAAFLAPYALAALLNTTVALLGAAATVASAVGAGVAQFGVSLAQGNGFKDALIQAGIAAGAAFVGAKIGSFLTKALPNVPFLGPALSKFQQGLSAIGDSIGNAFNAAFSQTAKSAFAQGLVDFVTRASLRVGSDLVSETFGRKLGAFGTVFAIAVGSTIAAGLISGALGSPINTSNFGAAFSKSVFSGALQGGIVEALKGETGLGAQFLRSLGFETASNLDINKIGVNFRTLQNRPDGSNPIYDVNGYIRGFQKTVGGVAFYAGTDGKFQHGVDVSGRTVRKHNDYSGTDRTVFTAGDLNKDISISIIDPRTNEAASVPSVVISKINKGITSLRESGGEYIAGVMNKSTDNLISAVDLLKDLYRQPTTYETINKVIDGEYNIFHETISPKILPNPFLDKLNLMGAETLNFSFNVINSLNNTSGHVLSGVFTAADSTYSGLDSFIQQKYGVGFDDLQYASLANGPNGDEILASGLLFVGKAARAGKIFFGRGSKNAMDDIFKAINKGNLIPPKKLPSGNALNDRIKYLDELSPYNPSVSFEGVQYANENVKNFGKIGVGYAILQGGLEILETYGFFEPDQQDLVEDAINKLKRPIETIPTELYSPEALRNRKIGWYNEYFD